jgi:exodeoxyribonuclease V alpha subunit
VFFAGRVVAIMFKDAPLFILKVTLDGSGEVATVKGPVTGPEPRVGSWFGFEAHWANHPKYGRQLAIDAAPKPPPDGWTLDTVKKVLTSHGVGAATLQILEATHGEALPEALDDKTLFLATAGLDEFSLLYIHTKWIKIQAHFKALDILSDLNLPKRVTDRIWSALGDGMYEVLSTNPWTLVHIAKLTFQQADEIAQRMKLPLNRPERLTAAIQFTVKDQMTMGHIFKSTGDVFEGVCMLIPETTQQVFAGALTECHKEGTVVLDRATRKGTTAVFDPWFAELERESAAGLLARQEFATYGVDKLDTARYSKGLSGSDPLAQYLPLKVVARNAIATWSFHEKVQLNDLQKQGVLHALTEPVSILTGLPGSGKTTALKAAVQLLRAAGVPFLLCAPTGIAAKNLGIKTGADAFTIHRAFSAKGAKDAAREAGYTGVVDTPDTEPLEFSDDGGVWGYGPQAPHAAEVVIVDESSMLDQHLLYRLLNCTSLQTRFVFVGDAAQLPSVGPGNVLRDLIKSGCFPTVNLTEIFRQKDTSAIVFASHAIHKGQLPDCKPPSDFSLLSVTGDDEILATILKITGKLYERRTNFQVLSPRHGGTLGVTNLNAKIRDLINPSGAGLHEIRLGGDTVREDDRIMVIRNDYRLGVYNGDVGKVDRIDHKAKVIALKIFGDRDLVVEVPISNAFNTIRLAYAVTVHKCQGLEYDVIVMPVVEAFRHQLQRNLLYTAVTRARQKVILVGSINALASAIANDREDLRNTLLADRLRSVEKESTPPAKE